MVDAAVRLAKRKASRRKWRVANLERERERARKRYAANPEKAREAHRKRRAANPERKRERDRKWRAANPEKVRYADIQYRAGFSAELFNFTLAFQGNACAVCGRPFSEKLKPHADHDHDARKPRGILCRNCNTAEGHIKKTGVSPAAFAVGLTEYLANPPATGLDKKATLCDTDNVKSR